MGRPGLRAPRARLGGYGSSPGSAPTPYQTISHPAKSRNPGGECRTRVPLEWQALAPDIVIELASKSRIAQVLAMTAACANWRAAIASVQADAQVWKALLAHRFPRLKVGPPNRLTNRQLYRVQLDVKALRQMPISAPPATPPPAKLRDFTFTIELTLMSHGEDEDGKPRAPRDRMHIGSTDTWVGKLREATSPSISFARFDGAHEIGCQLDLAPFAFDDDRRARCCVYLTTPSLQTVSSFTTALAKRPVTTFVTAMMRPSLTWLCRVRMLGLTLSGHLVASAMRAPPAAGI